MSFFLITTVYTEPVVPGTGQEYPASESSVLVEKDKQWSELPPKFLAPGLCASSRFPRIMSDSLSKRI